MMLDESDGNSPLELSLQLFDELTLNLNTLNISRLRIFGNGQRHFRIIDFILQLSILLRKHGQLLFEVVDFGISVLLHLASHLGASVISSAFLSFRHGLVEPLINCL